MEIALVPKLLSIGRCGRRMTVYGRFYRDGRDRDLGAFLFVELDHFADIHPVDVVCTKDRRQLIVRLVEEIEILVDSVGRTFVPGLL